MAKTPPSQLAAQVALAKARISPASPDLIDANDPAWLGAHLLAKRDVLAITNVTFPTIWAWMRAGRFPRARVVVGKSMWLSSEIEAWLASLPVRKLKGDAPEVQVEGVFSVGHNEEGLKAMRPGR